ncbi:MAG: hypothetical protein E6H53_04745 [Betaproteobacteria bacterium]|nr:MAG: hypothetical protein E6H53_04745 [Betaproteobacteria bacterium]
MSHAARRLPQAMLSPRPKPAEPLQDGSMAQPAATSFAAPVAGAPPLSSLRLQPLSCSRSTPT